jgi:hypothetical protein
MIQAHNNGAAAVSPKAAGMGQTSSSGASILGIPFVHNITGEDRLIAIILFS